MEESEQLLSGILLKAINDNAWKPDVTLSLGEKKLPAHRYLLAEHPSVLKAMLLGIDKVCCLLSFTRPVCKLRAG